MQWLFRVMIILAMTAANSCRLSETKDYDAILEEPIYDDSCMVLSNLPSYTDQIVTLRGNVAGFESFALFNTDCFSRDKTVSLLMSYDQNDTLLKKIASQSSGAGLNGTLLGAKVGIKGKILVNTEPPTLRTISRLKYVLDVDNIIYIEPANQDETSLWSLTLEEKQRLLDNFIRLDESPPAPAKQKKRK